jgi:predicted Zn-dependent protease
MIQRILITLTLFLLAGCATSPLGRQQVILVPDDQLSEMGSAAYQQIKQETRASTDAGANRYVKCVANALTRQVGTTAAGWEVTVFVDQSPNAFALPGGKIGVNTGMLKVAENQHQLAAVIAHEVAHVVARHPNERVSNAQLTDIGLNVLSGGNTLGRQNLLAALGAQYGILLPFGRAQETEADQLGLDIMAKAGFDPRQSVNLWQNMARVGGGGPPEFLSTHPSGSTRIDTLNKRIPQAMKVYEQARASGRDPGCK